MKSLISFVFILIISLFLNVSNSFSEEIGFESNNKVSGESNVNNEKRDNNDKNEIPRVSNEDIFGDEQAFPFIAGLGKNAAH